MANLVPPHGGELVSRLAPKAELAERLAEVQQLPKVVLSSREVSDLIMIGIGAFSPLTGFMGRQDYRGSMSSMHLASGTLWPVPITLAPTEAALVESLAEGERVALVDGDTHEIVGTMTLTERFPYDKQEEAVSVFRTDDPKHPGVQKLYAQGDVCLAGEVTLLSESGYPERFPNEYARPVETRAIFTDRGWSTVVAFQTRNPLHRSHEYLTKVALEIADGLFLHPIVGALKEGDIPAETRMKCYHVLLDRYYPADRVVMKVYPMEMRYAGPREAILHGIIRQNFGCSHLCVGRDHAGVGDYYGPFEAQEIFDELAPGELHLKPLKFENTFYCYRCEGMASTKTCPHGPEDRLNVSGTKLRAMLAAGERPPEEFSRPEVIEVLMEYYRGKASDK
jgi:sulfate adenylyltransferase